MYLNIMEKYPSDIMRTAISIEERAKRIGTRKTILANKLREMGDEIQRIGVVFNEIDEKYIIEVVKALEKIHSYYGVNQEPPAE